MTAAAEIEELNRRRFARVASFLLWVFALCFAAGALQVVVALRSNQIWRDVRGNAVSIPSMQYELLFLIVAALIAALLAWYWHRNLRPIAPDPNA
jgi:ABC-type Mn2+/Zn2+ transport system permease subunit